MMKVRRALISLSDKSGIIEFCSELHKLNIQLLSTGGTAKALREAGLPVTDVSKVTGFPEIMDGRVKTLHPKIHGGLLAVRDNPAHMQALEQNGIEPIDLVCINLYPFEKTVAQPNVSLADAIENIDIGGPAMIRASAKNYHHVAVVTDPKDYPLVLKELARYGAVTHGTRELLAIKAFNLTSRYDGAIDSFLSARLEGQQNLHLHYSWGTELRYGENGHQAAWFYKDAASKEMGVSFGQVLAGKPMSYNNYIDANAALEAVKDFDPALPAVAVVKHTNPCGLATGKTAAEALARAWEGDPISAFGGVIACNQVVDLAFAKYLKGEEVKHYSYTVKNGEYIPTEVRVGKFVEVIVAPGFEPDALEYLRNKSKQIRLIETNAPGPKDRLTVKSITGGVLVQERDQQLLEKFEVVTKRPFDGNLRNLAEFTLLACKHTKSNAIVLGREYAPGCFQVLGMGAGQPNRVDSMRKLALPKALENFKREWANQGQTGDFEAAWAAALAQMVMASDAFLPFDDTIREAHSLGIRLVVQPGGSMRDEDSIKACDELGMSMAFTGLRHFNH